MSPFSCTPGQLFDTSTASPQPIQLTQEYVQNSSEHVTTSEPHLKTSFLANSLWAKHKIQEVLSLWALAPFIGARVISSVRASNLPLLRLGIELSVTNCETPFLPAPFIFLGKICINANNE